MTEVIQHPYFNAIRKPQLEKFLSEE